MIEIIILSILTVSFFFFCLPKIVYLGEQIIETVVDAIKGSAVFSTMADVIKDALQEWKELYERVSK